MVRLTPFGFTWDGDWTLFSRMAAAYVQELSLPGEALLQAELRTLLIRRGQQQSDALLLRKVLLDGGCAGFLCCRLHDAQGEAELLALTLQADRRRQGHGRQTLHALESELRRRAFPVFACAPTGTAGPSGSARASPEQAKPWRRTFPAIRQKAFSSSSTPGRPCMRISMPPSWPTASIWR